MTHLHIHANVNFPIQLKVKKDVCVVSAIASEETSIRQTRSSSAGILDGFLRSSRYTRFGAYLSARRRNTHIRLGFIMWFNNSLQRLDALIALEASRWASQENAHSVGKKYSKIDRAGEICHRVWISADSSDLCCIAEWTNFLLIMLILRPFFSFSRQGHGLAAIPAG